MPLIEIRDAHQFHSALRDAKQKLVVVDFFAEWCAPCKGIAPIYSQFSERYQKEAVFLKVDSDKVKEVAQQAGVKALPTFVFYHEGKIVDKVEGADAGKLEKQIIALAAKYTKSSFSGTGYSLSGSSGSSSSASSQGKSGGGFLSSLMGGGKSSSTPAAQQAAPAPTQERRRNPWADPNFMPGGKSLKTDAPASSSTTAAKPAPTTAPANKNVADHWANKDLKAAAAPAPAPTPVPAPTAASTSTASISSAPTAAPSSTTTTSIAPSSSSQPDQTAMTDVAPSMSSGSEAVSSSSSSTSSTAPTVNDPSLTKNLNQQFLQMLLDMGFSQLRSEKALILTGNKGIEQALNWLTENESAPDIDEPLTVVGSAPKAGSAGGDMKLPPNWDDMTDEEQIIYEQMMKKKQGERGVGGAGGSDGRAKSTSEMSYEEKMEWLANKRAEVKARKEREEMERIKTSEKSRRVNTHAIQELKEKLEDDAAKAAYAQKKKEEEAARKARNDIRAKIAAEKAERKARLEREMAEAKAMKEKMAAAQAQKK